MFSLVETHTTDMDFQLEIQTSIQGFNAKVKSKAKAKSGTKAKQKKTILWETHYKKPGLKESMMP